MLTIADEANENEQKNPKIEWRMIIMTKKNFNELTEKGQKARLAKYAKERAERGTTDVLCRAVRPAKIKDIAGGNKSAVFRLAIYNKDTEKTEYITASAFIKGGKTELEAYYAGVTSKDLLSVEYKESNGYTNIYNMITREKKNNTKTVEAAPQEQLEAPLPA